MIVKEIWAGEARFDPRRQHGAQTGAQIVDKLAARHFFVRVYTWTIGTVLHSRCYSGDGTATHTLFFAVVNTCSA